MRSAAVLGLFTLVALHTATPLCTPAHAQTQRAETRLKANRDELSKIRREREDLQRKMEKLKTSAHSLNDELKNLNRQHEITARAVKSLDKQRGVISDAVKETTASLVAAEDEAIAKRAILHRRLIDIYKRGAMYDFEALLSAESFGALVARYKYLHELAVRDRALVRRVDALGETIRKRRAQLVSLRGAVNDNRVEKQQEESRLTDLETRQKKNLVRIQADAKRAEARMRQLARAEAQINSIIANLETARTRPSAGARARPRAPSTIRTSDYGKLAWPVEGTVLYNFGRVVNPNNTVTRWNGIGIAAPTGTPVKAVADGEVRYASRMGLYGNAVILEHGGGDYSVYASLASMDVRVGSKIRKGQAIGTVGSSDPDQPPHLHFEIRHNGPAIDPTTWLRNSR